MAFAAFNALYGIAVVGSSSPLGIIFFDYSAALSIMVVVRRVLMLLMMADVDDLTFVVAAVTMMATLGRRGRLPYQGQ